MGDGRLVGDLKTGAGLADALSGVDTVLHLATGSRPGDAETTRTLLEASHAAGVSHFVYISIVGIDAIPVGYYRVKLECERMITASPLPHTILRATQFHDLIAKVFSAQRYSPVIVAPSVRFQPIAVEEVAGRLVSLVDGGPAGRVDDIGGPEQLTGRALADAWKSVRGSRRPVWPLRLPGATFRALASGKNMVDGEPYGIRTWGDFLASGGSALSRRAGRA